jgi:peptidylprolyl isomerase
MFPVSARALAALLCLSSLSCGTDAVPTIETAQFASSLGVDLAKSTLQPNGVYYRDLVVGTGATITTGTHLFVNYSGWLTNGALFDQNTSANSPFDFIYGQASVIVAWNHGFTGMQIGGTRQLIVPPSAGYGSTASRTIPANSILVFNVTAVNDPGVIETRQFAAALGVDLAHSTKQSNGVYYRDLVVGTGADVKQGDVLYAQYQGWLADGTLFDQNQSANSPFAFVYGAGTVIVAWDQGLTGMKIGGTRQLIAPPSAGYGIYGFGPVPGNAILVFNVTLVIDPGAIETRTFASALGVDLAHSTKQPNGMYLRDLTLGTGATVSSGSHVYVHYKGYLADGTLFGQNLADATPFDFVYGSAALINAWNTGLTGMQVGGVRQLVVPPADAYGPNGLGNVVPPNAILVINVSLVDSK